MFGIYPKKSYICIDFIVVFVILTNVATKIQQILEANPSLNVLFGEWLARVAEGRTGGATGGRGGT